MTTSPPATINPPAPSKPHSTPSLLAARGLSLAVSWVDDPIVLHHDYSPPKLDGVPIHEITRSLIADLLNGILGLNSVSTDAYWHDLYRLFSDARARLDFVFCRFSCADLDEHQHLHMLSGCIHCSKTLGLLWDGLVEATRQLESTSKPTNLLFCLSRSTGEHLPAKQDPRTKAWIPKLPVRPLRNPHDVVTLDECGDPAGISGKRAHVIVQQAVQQLRRRVAQIR